MWGQGGEEGKEGVKEGKSSPGWATFVLAPQRPQWSARLAHHTALLPPGAGCGIDTQDLGRRQSAGVQALGTGPTTFNPGQARRERASLPS